MKSVFHFLIIASLLLLIFSNCTKETNLTDQDIENLVRRSYQYVALYNVNNKFAIR